MRHLEHPQHTVKIETLHVRGQQRTLNCAKVMPGQQASVPRMHLSGSKHTHFGHALHLPAFVARLRSRRVTGCSLPRLPREALAPGGGLAEVPGCERFPLGFVAFLLLRNKRTIVFVSIGMSPGRSGESTRSTGTGSALTLFTMVSGCLPAVAVSNLLQIVPFPELVGSQAV